MSTTIKTIFKPQLKFDGIDETERFLRIFTDLYRIELLKDGLDLILTMLKQQRLKFEVKIIKDWDTNVGCYLLEKNTVFNKALGIFVTTHIPKIIIRQISYNVIAHEMAHALAYEAKTECKISLGEEFRKAVGLDMKDREPSKFPLKSEIRRLMVDALRTYPTDQFLGELFSRFFELLSVSRNVSKHGEFTTAEVMDYFANTTKYFNEIYNPKIRARIDKQIAAHTTEIAKQLQQAEPQNRFADKTEKFQRQGVGWSKNVQSNAMWQQAWNKHQGQLLGNKKSDEIDDK